MQIGKNRVRWKMDNLRKLPPGREKFCYTFTVIEKSKV